MNYVDIILVILLLSAAVSGFIKGFFVELASIVSLILGIWAGAEFSSVVQHWLSQYVSWSDYTMKILSFILIFVFVVLAVHLIATLTEKFVAAISLSIFSRLAGGIFGGLKAAFLLSILMIVITKIEELTITIIPPKEKAESKLYQPIERMAPNIFPFLKSMKEQEKEPEPKNLKT